MKLQLRAIASKIGMGLVLACLVLTVLPAAQVYASSNGDELSPANQRRLKRVEKRCELVKKQLTDSTKLLEQATAVRPGFAQFISEEKSRGFFPTRLEKLLVAFDQQVELTKTQRAEGLAFLADTDGLTSNCEVVNLELADTNSYKARLRMLHIQNGFVSVYRQIHAALGVFKLGVDTNATLPSIPARPIDVMNQ
jgi:hypothetical protein